MVNATATVEEDQIARLCRGLRDRPEALVLRLSRTRDAQAAVGVDVGGQTRAVESDTGDVPPVAYRYRPGKVFAYAAICWFAVIGGTNWTVLQPMLGFALLRWPRYRPRSRPMICFMISLEPPQILLIRWSAQALATRYSDMKPYPPCNWTQASNTLD
jgi:hypothetical protein